MYWAVGAMAHGGGELIIRSVEIGPYRISVWVNPPDPRANTPTHFTVGLASPVDNTPVLDANVSIEMEVINENAIVYSAPATTDQSINKLFYEADLDINQAGQYKTTIKVKGPSGAGEIDFETLVKEPSRTNWLVWGFVGLGVVLIFGLWRSRRAHREKSEN